MQEYLTIFLLLSQVLVVFCEGDDKEIDNSVSEESKEESVMRRRLPIFPRNKIKFVVTPKPHIAHILNTHPPRAKIMTKMPLMPPVTQTLKKLTALTQTARKPLMKLRTFTIQSRGKSRYNNTEKTLPNSTTVPNKVKILQKTDTKLDFVTEYFAEHITEVYFPEEINPDNISLPKNTTDKNDNDKKQVSKTETPMIKFNVETFSSEEEQDRNEFIFLENKKVNLIVNDMLDSNDQDMDDPITTTEIIVRDNTRIKRSKNIIEEENMGTTISGFKYTGRDTRLVINDMYFKNIHS